MDFLLKEKHKSMIKIERCEKALVEISKWKKGDKLSKSTLNLINNFKDGNSKEVWTKSLEDLRESEIKNKMKDGGKLYLSQIIEKEKPVFSKNNLILAPTGSGKTHFIKSIIKYEEVLLLVSTTSLKEKFVPSSEEERKKLGNRMYSTKNKNVYGEGNYKILVMTYAEFGQKMEFKNKFANKYKQIFCDEIHSLFNYYQMSKDLEFLRFSIIMRYLFEDEGRDREVYYFTATDEYLNSFAESVCEDFFSDVKVFNYLNHPEIIKNMVLSSYKISSLDQVKMHINSKRESFKHFGYKIFAYCKTIARQLYLKEILEKEGLRVLVLWSVNNKKYKMDSEQLKQRAYLLETGMIPDEYDVLIINSSMQEGWDLIDLRVKLAIINTINKTELIQALGRIRGDVDSLLYKSDSNDFDLYFDLPEEFIGTNLTSEMKEELSKKINIKNHRGILLKWNSIKKELLRQGYIIEDKVMRIDSKSTRVSIIHYE